MIELTLTTPAEITEFVARCAAKLSSEHPYYVPYEFREGTSMQRCFPNVAAAVEADGGERVLGWMVWEMPGAFIEAIHHAVWRKPDGSVVDITPKADGEPIILFVPDIRAAYSGKFIDPKRFAAFGNALAREFIKVRHEMEALIEPYRKVGRYYVPPAVAAKATTKLHRSERLLARLQAGERK